MRNGEADHRTGLLNRCAFEKRFEAARAHWDESQQMLAFVLFDIDNFKTIIDTHGRQAGGVALKAVADLSTRPGVIFGVACISWRHAETVSGLFSGR